MEGLGFAPHIWGIGAIFLATLLAGVVWWVLRNKPRTQDDPRTSPGSSLAEPVIQDGDAAVFLVHPGGKIGYLNKVARVWFGIAASVPNLERLSRRARPGESFLRLCSTEGKAFFSMDGRLVEGQSYYVPEAGKSTGDILVSLRRMPVVDPEHTITDRAVSAGEIIAQFDQAISSSLDSDQTIKAILEVVEQIIPLDFAQISILDKADKNIRPYRLLGITETERRLDDREEYYAAGMGLSGIVIGNHHPLVLPDVDNFCAEHPDLERAQYPFKSYLGLPLLVEDELIGVLELASLTYNAFGDHDLAIATKLSKPAAIALRNSLAHAGLKKQLVELAGLTRLTQSSGGQRNTLEFYTNLIEGIVPLVRVASIGFLIYDEARRRLAAQAPLIGIPAEFVPVYQVTLPPGSEAEKVWLSQQMIVANPAPEDPQISALGLSGLVQAAGLVNVALLPLTPGSRMLGYLQVADKLDGSMFNQDDLRVLSSICGQTATVIENLLLVKQSQERALRSETMRRIASLTGSVATVDEILAFSLRELARLLRVDVAAIFLIDESRAELRVHPGSIFGIDPDVAIRLGRVSMNAPEYLATVTSNMRPIFCDDASQDDSLASSYRLFAGVMGLNALIAVPILVRERAVGEVLLCSGKAEFFDPSDLILLTTVASQIASAIEKSTLYTQTDESLQRRVEQLTALTRISRELNSNLDLRSLLELVYTELLRTTKACCGFIALYSQGESQGGEREAFIQVGDEADDLLSPLETKVMAFEEPIIVSDYHQPIKSLGNQYLAAPHADVVSSLIVPISYQEGIAGLIHLHSREIGHFDTTSLEITQTLAAQAAIALGNASRYYDQRQKNELLNRRVETIERLMEAARSLSPDQPLNVSLEAIAYGIQESTPFDVVLVGIYQSPPGDLRWLVGAGLPLEILAEYRSGIQSWQGISRKLSADHRFGTVFFIPADQVPYQLEPSIIDASIQADNASVDQKHVWQPGDELFVLVQDTHANPLGLIRVDRPRDEKRPDRPTLESLQIFASQASLVIESHQMLHRMGERLKLAQEELDQTRESLLATQGEKLYTPSAAEGPGSGGMPQGVPQLQPVIELSELVNHQNSRNDILRVFAEQVLIWLDMTNALVVEIRGGEPRVLLTPGITPQLTANLDVMLGQRNPIKTTIQNKELLWVPLLDENQEWKDNHLLNTLQARAFICLPVLSGSDVDVVVMLLTQNPLTSLSWREPFLLEILCRQVAVALEKARFQDQMNRQSREVNLLIEFSRQLGSLDALSILRNLAATALSTIPNAQAGMVALWQAEVAQLAPQVAIGYVHSDRMLDIQYQTGQALPGKVFASGEALICAEVNFSKEYNLSREHLLIYRDATEGRLPVSSLVIPIQTTENKLGVIVLDNFKEAGAFTQDDLNLVTSLAYQTALTLEHARLFQAAERRAVQLEALTSVAGTLTSSLRTEDLVNTLLGLVGSIIPYDTGTLWLRKGDKLIVQAASGFDDSDQRLGLVVATEDSNLLKDMIVTTQPILVNDVRLDPRFPQLIEPRHLTWLGIPLVSKGAVVGVIALEKLEANYYVEDNIKAMVTFAGQTATALENARLYEESTQRAEELAERSQRLTLLNRFSAELSGSLDLSYILDLTMRELIEAVHCDSVSVLLFDANNVPLLEAEQPEILSHYPIILPGCPVFDRLFETLGIFVTDNVTSEHELESLKEFLAERSTRAILIVPLITGADLQGLLIAHSRQPVRFEADEIELGRTISNQAAVAIQNARLFQETERLFSETQQRSAELGILFELGVNITQVLDQDRLIDTTFENVTRMLGADTSGLVMAGPDQALELRALDRGERIGPLVIAGGGASFSEHVLKTGESLFIRDIDREHELLPVQGFTLGEPVKTWLGVPLMVRGITTGVLSVQSYRANAFGDAHLRLLGQVGNQLAVALDNARLFGSTQIYAADLERRVSERTSELEKEHHRSQTLLRIITELSASLDQDMVLNRTLEILNESIGAEYSMILLVHPEQSDLYLRSWMAAATSKPIRKFTGGWKSSEPLARWVVTNAQPVLVPDLLDDERWPKGATERSGFHSVIAAPLLMGAESLGALLLFHRQVDRFTQDMTELAQAAAKQIAVSINNTQLFNLIRDQAERLGELLRSQHVETSRSQAMLEAVADGVLVTDSQRTITLFNASAEKILKLNRTQVLGRSLEDFIGMFGQAAQDWVRTIQDWSEDPNSRKPGESKSAQIELDDQRVVSVHLSPVLMRNDFLGTVSIFQDITHLVELDRLKSEFVATVSHELRTPMTSIKGYVEILLMGAAGSLSDTQTHFLQVVRSNTDRLATLVNDLLDISRIEAGRVTLTMRPIEPQHIIRNSMDMISRRSMDEKKPMQVDMEFPPDLPRASGDRERVQQILDNLVQNAYQYTPDGGRIVLRAEVNGAMMQFSVQDDGVGIPKEDQARIFERFYRGENPLVLATSGTGLGLSIVQHLVEMHGGAIWFESPGAPGLGSKFFFTIPLDESGSTDGSST